MPRGRRGLWPLLCFLSLTSCGYIGPVVPPSPLIPTAVGEVSATEQGDRLLVTFAVPLTTTDNVPIRSFSSVQVRIAPAADETAAKVYEAPPPENLDPDQPPPTVTFSTPVTDWVGKQVSIDVRTAVKAKKKYSTWSKASGLDVISPLAPPVLAVSATAAGYALTWPDVAPDASYVILRKGPADSKLVEIGTADKPEYTDGTAQWNTPYTYQVIARQGNAESLPSNAESVNHPDTFPPSVPAGLAAVATKESIELSWQRDTEPDLKGYYVFRSVSGGPYQKIGDVLSLPAFSDRTAEHGKTYSYQVSAIDQTGNESQPSPPVSVPFP